MEEIATRPSQTSIAGQKAQQSHELFNSATKLSEISSKGATSRFHTNIQELDRVLGGGFVDGEVVLLGGLAGAGKSTLALSVAQSFANSSKKVLYSSGEESEEQIALRANRMQVESDNIFVINETDLDELLAQIHEHKPDFVIVDSLQTLASNALSSSIGSIAQSKEAAHALTRLAKQQGITMLLINQVTKDSGKVTLAGSNQIAHIVDCVLIFESDIDSPLKYLRATKNRFGDATDVGIFQHSETGLIEVSDPSGVLLELENEPLAGEAAGFIAEGIRQIPVSVQALVTESSLSNPRKQFSSIDNSRGQIICAILDKFTKLRLYDSDVFAATMSGVRVLDPLADLAIAAAMISSAQNKTHSVKTAYIGEMSLTGRVRGTMIAGKIKEAERLGFDRVVVPKSAKTQVPDETRISIRFIENIEELPKIL